MIDESADDEAGKQYAILLSDTVTISTGSKAAEVLTVGVPKAWKDVAYYLKVRHFED